MDTLVRTKNKSKDKNARTKAVRTVPDHGLNLSDSLTPPPPLPLSFGQTTASSID
jgi:hypothetical protein